MTQNAAFLDLVTTWASGSAAISALVVVGSHARGAALPDSDVELLILSERAPDFLADVNWIRAFGDVDGSSTEEKGRVTLVRVRYAGGLQVEFGLTVPAWATQPDDDTRHLLRDGFRVLFDRDSIFSQYDT